MNLHTIETKILELYDQERKAIGLNTWPSYMKWIVTINGKEYFIDQPGVFRNKEMTFLTPSYTRIEEGMYESVRKRVDNTISTLS